MISTYFYHFDNTETLISITNRFGSNVVFHQFERVSVGPTPNIPVTIVWWNRSEPTGDLEKDGI